MGHYLSSPNKEKITEEGEYKNMKYVACGMQGTTILPIPPSTSLYKDFLLKLII